MDCQEAVVGLKRYFSNAAWLFFERAFASFLSFCVGVYVIRYLGPAKFGILSYALSFVGLFSGIATLGLDSIVIRDLVQKEEETEELLGTAFMLKLAGALFVLFALVLLTAITSHESSTNWVIFFIALASVFQSLYVIDFYFQSKVLSKYPVWVRCFSSVTSSVFKGVLIWFHASLIWFAFAVTLESVFVALGFVLIYTRQGLRMSWTFKKDRALRLLRDSWPLILSGVAIAIYMRIDQVLIKSLLDTNAVGIYAVAVNLTEIWYFIPTIIIGSLFPAIINAKKNNVKLYLNSLQRLHDIFFLIAFVIALAVSLCSGKIIDFLFGSNFTAAKTPLVIYIWATVFVFQGHIRGHFLIIENKQQLGLWFRIAVIITSVALNLLFIPRYGIVGAAVATLLAYSLPIYCSSFFHPVLKMNVLMCLKSFILPLRLAYYGRNAVK
jgi:O-antigen/teichoic acid export membrane protein